MITKDTKKIQTATNSRLPDFMIIGAMKAGTSTLHHILASHPDVFIPDNEIFFYDMDDLIQHPYFFLGTKHRWYFPTFDEHLSRYLNWYESLFEKARKDQLVGEDSTTYLASRNVPERISRLNPEVKLIVTLRDPAARTYSHYWHLVKAGRGIYNFEDTLQIQPQSLIERSLYKKQIEHFLKFIPKERFYFIIFEEFIRHMEKITQEICKFLGVSSESIDFNRLNTHQNPTMLPRHLKLQLWHNRILILKNKHVNVNRLIDAPTLQKKTNYLKSAINRSHRRINPVQQKKPPAMKASTKTFLNDYFSKENKGLSELINKNTDEFWY